MMQPKIIISILALLITNSLFAQVSEYWGLTSEGGEYGVGTIFKLDVNGDSLITEKSFYRHQGMVLLLLNFVK